MNNCVTFPRPEFERLSVDEAIKVLERYPNLRAAMIGTVSGQSTEWPMVRTELQILLYAVHVHVQERIAAAQIEEGWFPMHTAPLDGTVIEILFRHFEYWTCLKVSGKAKAEKEYQAVQRAHWIDHNGGGWTWHGMAGSPMAWRPAASAESVTVTVTTQEKS